MTNSPTNTPAHGRPPRWWIIRIIAGIVLLNCCAWSGFGAWLLAPFSAWSANQFDRLQGDLETIAPAEWQPAGGILSPGGRYMLISWKKNGPHEQFIRDFATDRLIPRNTRASDLCWLNTEQFAAFGYPDDTYISCNGTQFWVYTSNGGLSEFSGLWADRFGSSCALEACRADLCD